jgi:hypothetical protein
MRRGRMDSLSAFFGVRLVHRAVLVASIEAFGYRGT